MTVHFPRMFIRMIFHGNVQLIRYFGSNTRFWGECVRRGYGRSCRARINCSVALRSCTARYS